MGTPDPATEAAPTTFAAVLRTRSFAVLFTAETISIVGDQLARVALAVLVFDRTSSAAATALTYASTFVPAIVGGFLLAGIGDRVSRRAVMVSCDVVRAALIAVMAFAELPIWALLALLVVTVLLQPAFAASEVSYLAEALTPEQYRAATGVRMVTIQGAQVFGFALGGVLVATLNPRGALFVDALTFICSGLMIRILLPQLSRPATRKRSTGNAPTRRLARLWSTHRVRYLLPLSALAGFFVVPEGLAVPFARDIEASTVEAGVLLAAIPLGGALGALVLVRVLRPAQRMNASLLMAACCGLPLIISAFAPPWPVAAAFWFLSGALAAYQVEINSIVVQQFPASLRAHGVGVFSALLTGAQGIGVLVFGLVAEWTAPGVSIACAAGVGSLAAVATGVAFRRNEDGADPSGTGAVGGSSALIVDGGT
ncbi:MFS transporter [uncultured Jatrophihabitans sp.]|uniref:MFS transporter n=1 Tax=uncultured Jatrophihabitans sp. TaxID=1610747 RepID=UPI0035CA41E5